MPTEKQSQESPPASVQVEDNLAEEDDDLCEIDGIPKKTHPVCSREFACGILVGPSHEYGPVSLDGILFCSVCATELRRWGYFFLHGERHDDPGGPCHVLVLAEGHLRELRVPFSLLLQLWGVASDRERDVATLVSRGKTVWPLSS